MDTFERLYALAEFAAKRGEDRRSVEFKSFFSYLTLLVFAFYIFTEKEDLSKYWNDPSIGCLIGFFAFLIHFFYCWWQKDLGVAMKNDGKRRNFFLAKAECVADYFLKNPTSEKFIPNLNKKVVVDFCTQEVSEKCLFQITHPPDIFITRSPSPLKKFRESFLMDWDLLWTDWARRFQVVIPTIILVSLFVIKLHDRKCLFLLSIAVVLLPLLILPLISYVLRKHRRKKSI